MQNRKLFLAWGILFLICALLGFIPEPDGLLKAIMVLLSLVFFVPGGILLYQAVKTKDLSTMVLLRGISLASLITTLVLLIINFLSVSAPGVVGNYLHGLLTILSAPMVCSQYWALSLYLWACLMVTSHTFLRKNKG